MTGSAGYLGTSLIRELREAVPDVEVIGLDKKPQPNEVDYEFHQFDLLRDDLSAIMNKKKPDTVIHLAFQMQMSHSSSAMRRLNVEGSQRVLDGVVANRPKRLMVCSSATAFGARRQQTTPHDDLAEVNGRRSFPYSRHKHVVEGLLTDFASEHTDCRVSWVRPTTVVGPHVDNYIGRFIKGMPVFPLLSFRDVPFQYVHESDVSRAFVHLLMKDATGPVNLAPSDTLTLRELGAMMGRPCVRIPMSMAYAATWLGWHARVPGLEFPPGFLWFSRYPWTVVSRRLVEEYDFRLKFTSREAIHDMLMHGGTIRSGLRLVDYPRDTEGHAP